MPQKNITIRQDPEDWLFQSKYLVVTPELHQRIFDDLLDAEQHLNRAEMGGDPDEIGEALERWHEARAAQHEADSYGELLITISGKEYYTQYWKEEQNQ